MSESQKIHISFPDVSPDQAGLMADLLAAEISREVREGGKAVKPAVVRADPTAMDFGATLVLVLGAPAVVVLANAIRDWARRTNRSKININGVEISNLESADVAPVITALQKGTPS